MTVSVTVQNSDSFDAYDILVRDNYSQIQPTGVQVGIGSSICMNGNSVSGTPSACGPRDGAGILHVTHTGSTSLSPVSGILFNVTYKVVQGGAGDMIGYAQGCSTSSVIGSSDCLSFTKSGATIPENAPFTPFNTNTQPPAGVVCIAPATATSCSTPSSFSGRAGTTLVVAVDSNITKSINGFDISVMTNPNILYPVSIDFNNSVIISPQSFVDRCVNGVLFAGPRCSGTDGPGIAHLAIVGPTGWMSLAPLSGPLFLITYRVLSSANSTIGFQTGCASSSVVNTGICVDLSNGTISPVPVSIVDPAFTAEAPVKVSLNKSDSLNSLSLVSSGDISFSFTAQNETLTGTITATLTNSTTGTIIVTRTLNVVLTLPFNTRGRFILLLPTSTAVMAEDCMIDQSFTGATCILTRNPDFNNYGTVNLNDVSMVVYAFGSHPGMSRYQPMLDLAMNGSIDLADASIEAAYFGAHVFS